MGEEEGGGNKGIRRSGGRVVDDVGAAWGGGGEVEGGVRMLAEFLREAPGSGFTTSEDAGGDELGRAGGEEGNGRHGGWTGGAGRDGGRCRRASRGGGLRACEVREVRLGDFWKAWRRICSE